MHINPYQDLKDGKWLKTNFHTHAGTGPNTCGVNPLETVIDLYRQADFDVLCISNHDLLTDTDRFTTDRMKLIPGVEYSQNEHMLTIGVTESLHGCDHQTAIDRTREMGGFTIICHPHFIRKDFWSTERLDTLNGFVGLEVMNMLIYRLGGSGRATDTWDDLLSKGRLAFGFGDDDFHALTDANRSYNLIYSAERSFEGVRKAVEAGAFCVSTGLVPDCLTLRDGVIDVKVKFPIDTYAEDFTYRFVGENGRVLSVQDGKSGRYEMMDEKYVRVEAIGENGAMLFFQPVYEAGSFRRP